MTKTKLNAIAAALLALACATTSTSASAADNADAVTVQGGRTAFKPVLQDFTALTGVYRLKNGDILRVSQQQKRFFSQVNDQPALEITPRAPGLFIAQDGVALRFSNSGEDVTVSPPQRLAAR